MLDILYSQGRKVHRGLYDRGVLKRRKLVKPVICIGNVSVGGTGKTPFLINLVNQLKGEGITSAVLSRGYKAEPPAKTPRIVSDLTGLRCSGPEAGDEPLLIAEQCEGTPVVIGSRRYESGALAEQEFNPDLFILDDGFQHEALERDLDIVLWDYRDLPSKSRQLPTGRMRENPNALKRAAAIILTHAEYVDEKGREDQKSRVKTEIGGLAPGVPIFEAVSELGDFLPVSDSGTTQGKDGPRQSATSPGMQDAMLMLVSGLARPEGFEAMVRATGLTVAGHLMRGDHAKYDVAAINRIRKSLPQCKADRILTTEKDAVKLSGLDLSGLSIWVAPLKLRIADDKGWQAFVRREILPLVKNN